MGNEPHVSGTDTRWFRDLRPWLYQEDGVLVVRKMCHLPLASRSTSTQWSPPGSMAASDWLRLMTNGLGSSEQRRTPGEDEEEGVDFFPEVSLVCKSTRSGNFQSAAGWSESSDSQEPVSSSSSASLPPPAAACRHQRAWNMLLIWLST